MTRGASDPTWGRTTAGTGAWDYLKEDNDYPNYMVRDWFAWADAKSLTAVKQQASNNKKDVFSRSMASRLREMATGGCRSCPRRAPPRDARSIGTKRRGR